MKFIGKMVLGTVIVLLTLTILVVGCSAAASSSAKEETPHGVSSVTS